jgi:LPS sulfotransferase NodH
LSGKTHVGIANLKQKRCIIAICGPGRSGSTILSLLLSQNQKTFNIGQSARDFWAARRNNRTCSCAATLDECAFWSSVEAHGFSDWDAAKFGEISNRMKAFVLEANNLDDWNDADALEALAAAHPEYLSALTQLVNSCFSISGAVALIDSSKSPEIALALSLTKSANLRVVNLRRDPRAVICSLAKRGLPPSKLRKKMRIWRIRDLQLHRWSATTSIEHISLNYASLVRFPRRTVAQLLGGIPIENPTTHFEGTHHVHLDWSRQHLYPPVNEHVLAQRPSDTVIQAPTEWRSWRYIRLHLTALRNTFPQGLLLVFSQMKNVLMDRDG